MEGCQPGGLAEPENRDFFGGDKKKGQTAKRLEKNDEKLLDPGCIERCEDSLDVLDDFHIFSYEKCGNPTTKIINVEKI